jgi:hypothetical protein
LKTKDGDIRVVEYWPYALRKMDVEESTNEQDGPALRFQLKNPNVNVTEWIVQEGTKSAQFDLGPAKVILTTDTHEPTPTGNAIVILPHTEKGKYNYLIFTASKGGITQKGVATVGQVLATGWMGLEFKAITIHQHASRKSEYEKLEAPTPLSTSAMRLEFKGRENWLGLNSVVRLFTDKKGYVVTYQNRRMDLGFDIRLTNFEIGRYQGTTRAASYKSEVLVEETGKHLISMNEPLKHKGYTFYQASFQENEMGQPVASVLSVNNDPGRWVKYLGASLILIGSLILFYFKKRLSGSGPVTSKEGE